MAESVISDNVGSISIYDELLEKAGQEKKGKIAGFHYYWKDGLHIDSFKQNFMLRIGGTLRIDTGNIEADSELRTDFPEFVGYETDLCQLSVVGSGLVFKWHFEHFNTLNNLDVVRFSSLPMRSGIKKICVHIVSFPS